METLLVPTDIYESLEGSTVVAFGCPERYADIEFYPDGSCLAVVSGRSAETRVWDMAECDHKAAFEFIAKHVSECKDHSGHETMLRPGRIAI